MRKMKLEKQADLLELFFNLIYHKGTTISYWDSIKSRLRSRLLNIRLNSKNVRFYGAPNRIVNFSRIQIGLNTVFGKGVLLAANTSYGGYSYTPFISIGKNCNFGDFLNLTAVNEIVIGNNVLTGRWVTISDNAHGQFCREDLCIPPQERKMFSKGRVVIKDNVWIGDKVTILAGVEIGESAIIGANSVITHDVPPFSIVAGCPARVLRRIANDSGLTIVEES